MYMQYIDIKSVIAVTAGVLLAAFGGCANSSSDDSSTGGDGWAGITVRVDPANGLIALDRGKKPVIELLPLVAVGDDLSALPHTAFAFRTAHVDVKMSFGSFRFTPTSAGPWRSVTALTAGTTTDKSITVGTNTAGELTLSELVDGAGVARGVALDVDAPVGANRASFAYKCRPGEHFIGLGGQSFDVDHRGQTVRLWVTEDGLGKHSDANQHDDWALIGNRHTTHTPMPVFISSAGYAIVVETTARVDVALCSEDSGVVRVESWDPKLRIRVFAAETPLELIDHLTAWLGRPAVPPAFAFGLWLDALYGSANVRRVAKKLRQLHVPAVALWTEDWRGGTKEGDGVYTLDEDWNLDADTYPDFSVQAKELQDDGFKWLTYNNTFITKSADIFDEAIAKGYGIHKSDGKPYTFLMHKLEPASLLDLTNPSAVKWATGVYRKGLEQGSAGYMADFCEWLPPDAILHSGEDALLVHNRYPVDYHAFNRALLDASAAADGKERLTFVRSAWLGSQPLVDIVWAGDQQTDWSAGDGMRSVIPMGLGLGVTGFAYFGHDIGGYADLGAAGPTTKELWYRWVTLGAMTPVMRTHHGRRALENWNWESDEASAAHIARWGRLHNRMFPYLWRAAAAARATGRPIMAPLALAHPQFEPGWTATDQYMLGDRLYVAPIVDEAATSRTVRLPAGTYRPLLGDGPPLQSDGVTPNTVSAAVAEIPVFVRAGTVVVLLPDAPFTLTSDYKAPTRGLAELGDDREVWAYLGGISTFAEVGDALTYVWDAGDLVTVPTSGTFGGQPVAAKDGAFQVVGPGTLRLGSAKLVITGGAADRTTTVRVR